MIATRTVAAALAAAALLGAAPERRCNVPVFRYALEHWSPDAFEVVVAHRGPLGAEDAKILADFEKNLRSEELPANAILRKIDVAARPEALKKMGLAAPPEDQLPWMAVLYPHSTRIPEPLWSGKLAAGPAGKILDSPARRDLVKRLLEGHSAVWILLEGGKREQDEAAAALLERELARLEKTLKLPELSTDPSDRISAEAVPLKLDFSLLRVSRRDPKEEMLVRMLLRSEPDLEGREEPMVFPAFGRGHILEALVGAGIEKDNVAEYGAFVVGPCSCQVKQLNPGLDLLVAADWLGALGNTAPEPPPVVEPLPILASRPAASPAPVPQPAPARDSRAWVWVAAGVAAALVLATGAHLLLMFSKGKC